MREMTNIDMDHRPLKLRTDGKKSKKVKVNTCYSALLQASPTAEALRYMARTKQRRTYLPYTFPAVAGTHLPIPKGWRVE